MTGLPQLDPAHDALFLDVDGTLIALAPRPEEVSVSEGLAQDLEILLRQMQGALALISGRTLDELNRLLPVTALPAAGVHGAVWRLGKGEVQRAADLPQSLRQTITSHARQMGLLYEDKGQAVAVHYRLQPEMRAELLARLRGVAATAASKVQLIDGDHVCEIVARSADKGMALARFMTHPPFRGRRPIFLGDDTTDEPAIVSAIQLGGVGIRVGAVNGPGPPEICAWLHAQSRLLDGSASRAAAH